MPIATSAYWIAMTLWSWLQMYLRMKVCGIVQRMLVIAVGDCNECHRNSSVVIMRVPCYSVCR